jgi:hypothetical protein
VQNKWKKFGAAKQNCWKPENCPQMPSNAEFGVKRSDSVIVREEIASHAAEARPSPNDPAVLALSDQLIYYGYHRVHDR